MKVKELKEILDCCHDKEDVLIKIGNKLYSVTNEGTLPDGDNIEYPDGGVILNINNESEGK